jgi:hypothetical protein
MVDLFLPLVPPAFALEDDGWFEQDAKQLQLRIAVVGLTLQALVLDRRDVKQQGGPLFVFQRANVDLLVLELELNLPRLPVARHSTVLAHWHLVLALHQLRCLADDHVIILQLHLVSH